MTPASLNTKRFRTSLSIGLIATLGIIAAIFIPAGAASNEADRFSFGDGQTSVVKNGTVKDGYVEFGNSTPNTSVPSTTSTQTTTPGQTPTGRFYVVGKQIVDPDGKIFLPMGANVAIRQANFEFGYTFNWRGTATGHSQDVLDWGWNTVRPNVMCLPPSDGPTVAKVNSGIDDFIKEYTAKKIVVMLDCHDVTGKNLTATDSQIQGIINFYDNISKKYKDNPYVWFNPLNEPISNGDTASVSAWTNLQNALYNKVRANAPYNIYVADLPEYGNGIGALVDSNLATTFGSNKCNVVYAWHAYGYIGGYADDAKHKLYIENLAKKNIAMVVGEIGDPLTLNEGTAGSPAQNRIGAYAVMNYSPQNEYGILWWHATGDSANFLTYALMQDRTAPWPAAKTGQGLSAGGKKFWDVSHAPKPNRKFVGNLSDSNCR